LPTVPFFASVTMIALRTSIEPTFPLTPSLAS
jgi:hypothetical protein